MTRRSLDGTFSVRTFSTKHERKMPTNCQERRFSKACAYTWKAPNWTLVAYILHLQKSSGKIYALYKRILVCNKIQESQIWRSHLIVMTITLDRVFMPFPIPNRWSTMLQPIMHCEDSMGRHNSSGPPAGQLLTKTDCCIELGCRP